MNHLPELTNALLLHLALTGVWWGAALIVTRALTLALAWRGRNGEWLNAWAAPLVILNICLPSAIVYWLGMPLALAVALAGGALLVDGLVAATHRDWTAIGAQAYSAVPLVALTFFVYGVILTLATPMNWLGYALSAFLLAGEVASAVIDLYYTSELLEVLCRRVWRRRLGPWLAPVAVWPRVSVHVPTHNEEPEMVMATLDALAQLDYPNYEVILIDDNSNDAAIWRPVMDFCRQHGFKVFHLMQYPGYKAGALNFALHQTDPAAELIAVVDADYVVRPNWLRETAPYFLIDPLLAFLQTPQAFSYAHDDWYHHANALSEAYFFSIGMPARAERNTLIFCGTMGMIRRRVLERVGGWAEWLITEDAELSLRMLARGYHGAYVEKVYGRGTLPPTLADLKRQHYRWAFGSIQLTRAYLGRLLLEVGRHNGDPRQRATLGQRAKLSPRQRYDYVMHGAHWYHAFLQITLGVLLNVIALLRVFDIPFTLRPLVASAMLLPVLGVVIGVARVLWSSRVVLRCSWRDAWGVLFALLAVHWPVARACVAGFYRRRARFLRTPKSGSYVTLGYAFRSTVVESILVALALATVGGLLWRGVSAETLALCFLLLWQAFVMATAPILALIQAGYDFRRRRRAQRAIVSANQSNAALAGRR